MVRGVGRRYLLIGVDRDRHLLEGLDLIPADSPEDADFILNSGPDGPGATLEQFEPLLDRSAALKLPMICANPDLIVMVEGRQVLCAGALAAYYERRGGDVRYRGKPDPAIYQTCFSLLEVADKSRIVAVGDASTPTWRAPAIAGSTACSAAAAFMRAISTPDMEARPTGID